MAEMKFKITWWYALQYSGVMTSDFVSLSTSIHTAYKQHGAIYTINLTRQISLTPSIFPLTGSKYSIQMAVLMMGACESSLETMLLLQWIPDDNSGKHIARQEDYESLGLTAVQAQ